MDLNKFTIKSQQAIEHAFLMASEKNNQAVDNVHLIKGIFKEGENIIPFLFQKLNP